MTEKIGIVCDLDGTLVKGSNEVRMDGLNKAIAQAYGRTVLKGIINEIFLRHTSSHWGEGHLGHLDQWLATLKAEDRKKASDVFDRYLRQNLPRRMERIDGCVDTLRSLKLGGKVLGLTTATPRSIVTEVIFPYMGVPDGLFKYIESSESLAEEAARPKPHPYTITKILDSENLEPEQAVMVGDSQVDVEAGQRAGVEVVAVETGILKRKEAEKLGVKHIIPDITSLQRVLAQMERESV